MKSVEHLKLTEPYVHDTLNLQTRYWMQLNNYKLNSNAETYRRLLYTHRTHYALQNNNKYPHSNTKLSIRRKRKMQDTWVIVDLKWKSRRGAVIAKISPRIGQNTLSEQYQCIDFSFQSIVATVDQFLLHRWLVLRALNGDCTRTIIAMIELATAMCSSE